MQPKIVIIGASYLQAPLVEKAREMGYQTHVFAWEEGAVCKEVADRFYPISIKDYAKITAIGREIKPKGIVTISSDICSITVNRVASQLGLIGNTQECTELTTNKSLMRERLALTGIACPSFFVVESHENIDLPMGMKYPLIVKPTDRSGSIGVNYVETYEALTDAVSNAISLSFSGQAIVEEFIHGRELSVESISWDGKHYILQYTDKETTGFPHFVETGHHQPAELSRVDRHEIDKIVISSLDALEIKYGASHAELKIDETGRCAIIEIGARMGGDFIGGKLVHLSTGYDYVKGVIEVAVGDFSAPRMNTIQSFSGIYYIMATPGKIKRIIVGSSNGIHEFGTMVSIGETIQPITDSAQRPAYYIYSYRERLPYDPNFIRFLYAD